MRDSVWSGPDPFYPRGVALVVLGGLSLSPGSLLIRFIDSASDWQLVLYRSGFLALGVLCVLAVRHRSGLPRAFRQAGWSGLVGGVILGAGFVFYVLAIRHATVANALFLMSTAPFGAAILGWLILREPVPLVTWAAMILAVAGVVLMVQGGIASGSLFGTMMGLAAALSLAGLAITLRVGRGADMIPTVFVAGLVAALSGAALAEGWTVTLHDLLLCALMGGVQVNLGFLLMTLGSRYVPAAQFTLLTLAEVVFGPIIVWLVLGEVPATLTLVGGAMVLTAICSQAIIGRGGIAPAS